MSRANGCWVRSLRWRSGGRKFSSAFTFVVIFLTPFTVPCGSKLLAFVLRSLSSTFICCWTSGSGLLYQGWTYSAPVNDWHELQPCWSSKNERWWTSGSRIIYRVEWTLKSQEQLAAPIGHIQGYGRLKEFLTSTECGCPVGHGRFQSEQLAPCPR